MFEVPLFAVLLIISAQLKPVWKGGWAYVVGTD